MTDFIIFDNWPSDIVLNKWKAKAEKRKSHWRRIKRGINRKKYSKEELLENMVTYANLSVEEQAKKLDISQSNYYLQRKEHNLIYIVNNKKEGQR